MRKIIWIVVAVMAIVGFLIGGYLIWDQVTRVSEAELDHIVQRDGVPFERGNIPADVIDQLATNRVVVVGEFHFLREHRELTTELVSDLHSRGYRQYLFEWTQAADWLLDDFVNDGGLMPEWTPPHDIGGATITAIRDLNRTLPEDERIHVHAIDVTLDDYGGIDTFRASVELLAQQLPDPGPLTSFLAGELDSEESHQGQLESVQDELDAQRAELVFSWGEEFYDIVYEMVDVELRAIPVRTIRDSDYDESVRLREEAIKWLVDRRISGNSSGTLINVGNTHSQKSGLWGTEDIEWLGDYLVNRSQAAKGSVIAIWVAAQHIISVPGSGNPDFDLTDSPRNELLRVTGEIWPDQVVFLTLDDPLFSNGRVPLNLMGDIYVTAPKQQHDALFLLPVAHRDFVGD